MIKELRNLFYLFVIFFFIFFTSKYYFSDENQKNSYRSFQSINERIENYSVTLPIIKGDTDNIIEYVDDDLDKNKKSYFFWELLKHDQK